MLQKPPSLTAASGLAAFVSKLCSLRFALQDILHVLHYGVQSSVLFTHDAEAGHIVADSLAYSQVQCAGGVKVLQGPRAAGGPTRLRLCPGHVELRLHVCR